MAMNREWITLPDVAELLGIPVTRVRDLLHERHLLAVRREGDGVFHLPKDFLVEGESGVEVVATLKGTITVLADSGMNDDEIMRWLLGDNEELGAAPLDALRSGKRASVRRVAQVAY